MTTKNAIYNDIQKDVKDLEEKVKHVNVYNIKNYFKRRGIDAISLVHHVAPFVLAGVLLSSANIMKERKPFEKQMVEVHAKVSSMDTSTGYHHEYVSYDSNYDDRSIEYTTGWELKDGYYTRTITEFEISKKVDFNDIDSILKMSSEELKSLLTVTNIRTITKPELNDEDKLFMEPAVVVNSVYDSEEVFYLRKETGFEVFKYYLLYVLIIAAMGGGIIGIERIFLKNKINDKLGILKQKYKRISKRDLNELKKLLEIKKNNLEMITEQYAPLEEAPMSPRKVRK